MTHGVMAAIIPKQDNQFRKTSIGEDGELVWDGGLDFCPDSLYMKITGQSPEDYFGKFAVEHA